MADESAGRKRATSTDDDQRRVRLTERDRTIARLIARWGPVTQPQVARGAGMSRLPSFRRLQALRDGGFLHYERPLDDFPGVFTATVAGVELAGLVREAHGPPPSYALWPHLAAADAAIDAELGGVRTANRVEALADDTLRGLLPRTPSGTLVAPRALLLDDPPVAVYATVRPVAGPVGIADELVATALDAYATLAPGPTTIRVIVPSDVSGYAAVTALRQAGRDIVVLEPQHVGHVR